MSTTEKPTLAAKPGQKGIDPRGPRFGAGITAVILLALIAYALLRDPSTGTTSIDHGSDGEEASWSSLSLLTVGERLLLPSTIVLALLVALFAWGAFAGIQRHPYGLLFKALIRPRLKPPTELEDPVPPTFAQGIGSVITLVGLVLHVAGVPWALVIAASLAFIAAFLTSVFGYCLGCQIYLLLVRAGILGRGRAVTP